MGAKTCCSTFYWMVQAQAKGYGHFTHFLPCPLVGHYYQRGTVTQWLYRRWIPGYQMKDWTLIGCLVKALCDSWVAFDIFVELKFFCLLVKNIFEHCFWMLHLKTLKLIGKLNQLQIATTIPDFQISRKEAFISIKGNAAFLRWWGVGVFLILDIANMDVTEFHNWRETKKIQR